MPSGKIVHQILLSHCFQNPPYVWSDIPAKRTLLSLLKIGPRLARCVLQFMVVELLARELAHTELALILVCCNTVLADCVAVAIFDGLGGVRGVLKFVTVTRRGL